MVKLTPNFLEATVWLAVAAGLFHASGADEALRRRLGESEQEQCWRQQKKLVGSIEMYNCDHGTKIDRISYELLAALVALGYLDRMPLDPGGKPAWESYYLSRADVELPLACRVHGALDGARPAAPRDPLGADVDRMIGESYLAVTDHTALVGPVTAAALELPGDATVVSVDTLIERAGHPSPRTRAVAALALRRIRHPRGVPALVGLLADRDPAVRKQAVWGLGYLGSDVELPAIRKLIDDPEEIVRDAAVIALARQIDPDGATRCIALLADPKKPVVRRAEALMALADTQCASGVARGVHRYNALWQGEEPESSRVDHQILGHDIRERAYPVALAFVAAVPDASIAPGHSLPLEYLGPHTGSGCIYCEPYARWKAARASR